MSQKAKNTRAALKRKVKAERKARYKAEAEAGKERRFQNALSQFNPHKHQHRVAHCGNVGCARCYPLK